MKIKIFYTLAILTIVIILTGFFSALNLDSGRIFVKVIEANTKEETHHIKIVKLESIVKHRSDELLGIPTEKDVGALIDDEVISSSSERYHQDTDRISKKITQPRIAIIIDDLGYGSRGTEEMINFPRPLTLSILPLVTYSKDIALRAKEKGKEIMLHLPMEPHSLQSKPGPGVVKVAMTHKEIIEQMREDFASVPFASGVNNHMGSKATEDERTMRAVLSEIKARNLYFIDSRTSIKSVAFTVAREMRIPSARNRINLDNQDDIEYIKGRIRLLIDAALKDGEAIGIGHVRLNTFLALQEMIPEVESKGVSFVYVSDILR